MAVIKQERWLWLMESLGLESSTDCYEALVAAYSEKHRYYHTCEHINAMLRHLDGVKEVAENPAELELAIWFHDAIYKPYSKSNEKDSADWAKEFLESQNYDSNGIKRIYRMIMATLHDGVSETRDEKLLVDIDLAILGSPSDVYEQFEVNVRKEYQWVPSFIYRRKRTALLESFLNRDTIFNTPFFMEKYESTARKNIKRAILSLQK
jgi:predicted metal-dependent HD superfamily phosphohydrolase